MERDTRIELVTKPWQGLEIPLHQSRDVVFKSFSEGHLQVLVVPNGYPG